jgi:hypothetical protein
LLEFVISVGYSKKERFTSMGILCDFFIADGATVPNYDVGQEFDDADKCECKGLTVLEWAQFIAILRGQEYSVDLDSEFQLITPADADNWTMSVPQDMVDRLASLQNNQVAGIAALLATATSEELAWSANDFIPLITELAALARRAIATKKSMFLWNSL